MKDMALPVVFFLIYGSPGMRIFSHARRGCLRINVTDNISLLC